MVQFDKLRLSGFKSFVDPTELAIEPGMTGIVGPNGCGKSNLVEAMKWVMGETSAKQMRGSEMEDVIFSGTGTRPARNIAEVMLRAAEQNLARVQDVLVALEEQHKGLKRQARQASRYRNLSDHIRRAEAAVLALKLADSERELAQSAERLAEAEAQVADLTRLVGLATTAQAEAATALPPLRNDEAAAAAALQRLRVAHDALTAEAERVAQAQQEAETRLQQTESDLARERGRKSDAETATAELDGQRTRLEQERVGEDDRAAATADARDIAQAETHAAETEHDRLTRQIAADEALRDSVGREIAELQERLRRLAARREEIAGQ